MSCGVENISGAWELLRKSAGDVWTIFRARKEALVVGWIIDWKCSIQPVAFTSEVHVAVRLLLTSALLVRGFRRRIPAIVGFICQVLPAYLRLVMDICHSGTGECFEILPARRGRFHARCSKQRRQFLMFQRLRLFNFFFLLHVRLAVRAMIDRWIMKAVVESVLERFRTDGDHD